MLDGMRGKRVMGVAGALAGILAVASAATIELRSGDGILGVDGATGLVVRFADAAKGLEFVGGGEGLFRLVVIPRGGDPLKPLELSSREAKSVRRLDGEGLRLRFERIGGRDLSATCTIEAGAAGFFHFRIGVEGDAGTILERVDDRSWLKEHIAVCRGRRISLDDISLRSSRRTMGGKVILFNDAATWPFLGDVVGTMPNEKRVLQLADIPQPGSLMQPHQPICSLLWQQEIIGSVELAIDDIMKRLRRGSRDLYQQWCKLPKKASWSKECLCN